MARVKLVARAEITDEFVRGRWSAIFGDKDPARDDSNVGPNQTRGDYWAAVANSPETVKYVWDGFDFLANQKLARRHRELGMTRAGFLVGSKFVYSQHAKGLRRVGWSEEKIRAVPYWDIATCYDELERLLFGFTDCIVLQHGRVPEKLFEGLRHYLTDQEIVEFLHAAVMYAGNATVCRVLQVEYDDVP